MLLSLGAAMTPEGGSNCNERQSFINRFRAGVVMTAQEVVHSHVQLP